MLNVGRSILLFSSKFSFLIRINPLHQCHPCFLSLLDSGFFLSFIPLLEYFVHQDCSAAGDVKRVHLAAHGNFNRYNIPLK